MASVDISEWPFYMWKFVNFHLLNRKVKKGSVEGLGFNLILKHFCNTSLPEDRFKLQIEVLPQSAVQMLILYLYARTYIIDKSGKKRFYRCEEVTFDGSYKMHEVWDFKRDEIMENYLDMKQDNSEVWLVCILEPKTVFDICRPKPILENYPWISLEALSRDFNSLKNTPGDIKLTCGNIYTVHKNILLARCPKLADKLDVTSNFEVQLPDLDPSCVEFFIKYIYTGCLPDIQLSVAQKLYIFGSVYALRDLKKLCVKIMTSYLTEENMYDLFLLAHKYKDVVFKESITEYVLRENIIKTERWFSFSDMNIDIALEVYRAFVAKQ